MKTYGQKLANGLLIDLNKRYHKKSNMKNNIKIGKNATKVLQRRYLLQNEKGSRARIRLYKDKPFLIRWWKWILK